MAELTFDIDTGGAGDYVSLNAWESAQQQDLTDGGGDWMHATCRASGDAADIVATAIDGWTTAPASYILTDTANGEQAIKASYDAGRYRVEVSDATLIAIYENYVRINEFQIGVTITANNTAHGIYIQFIGTSDIRISNCRFSALSAAGTGTGIGLRFEDPNITVKVWNCIFENFISGADSGFMAVFQGIALSAAIYNSIFYNNNSGARINDAGGTLTCKNCVSFKNNDDFWQQSGTLDLDFNASDDNDGGNNVAESGGGAEWPDDFEDAAAGDWRIKATSNLKEAGVNDPSGSGLGDPGMDGIARPGVVGWTLGPNEAEAVAGVGLSLPIAMAYYSRIRRTSGD